METIEKEKVTEVIDTFVNLTPANQDYILTLAKVARTAEQSVINNMAVS